MPLPVEDLHPPAEPEGGVRPIGGLSRTTRPGALGRGLLGVLGLLVALPAPLFMPAMSAELRAVYTLLVLLLLLLLLLPLCWSAAALTVPDAQGVRLHPVGLLSAVPGLALALLAVGWWRSVEPMPAAAVTTMLALWAGMLLYLARLQVRAFSEAFAWQQEKVTLMARLQASTQETEQAMQARSRFLAAASHDLLQPVHAMQLLVSVLRRGGAAEEREQATQRLELTARSIDDMFRGLLDQARLDAGEVAARITPVSLDSVCRAVEAAYAPRCEEKGVAFVLSLPSPPLFVRADATLLERVLRNLVDNAVKFTEHGSVTVQAAREGHQVRVRVVDTGIGIDADDAGKVFDAFYRGARARGVGAAGVGLGLSVTQRMVRLMEGDIQVHASGGTGTCAQLTLPAAPASVAQMPTVPGQGHVVYRRVLVLENDRPAREALQLWLSGRGSQVLAVASLGEALVHSAQQGFAPELVVSDLRLERGPDGLAAIAQLRRRFGPVPAVLVTGETLQPEDLPQDVALLRKPLNPRELEGLIHRVPGTTPVMRSSSCDPERS